MDVALRRHYVAPTMSFLLVLSAVFNALTGAFVGVRAAEPVAHQQAPAVAAVTQAAEQKVVPVIPAAAPVTSAERPAVAETPAPPIAPALETDRLIE